MPDDDAFDPVLLDRYLAGELSAPERARVEAWLEQRPALAELVREAPTAALGAAAQHGDTDAAWQRLAARMQAAPGDQLAARRERQAIPVPQAARWGRRLAAAAALALVSAGGVATYMATRGGSLSAPLGRDVTAKLPDGTQLTLAAGSRIAWTASFGDSTRDVTLEGQGYFDVVHDATRPFRVHAREAVVQDVGTRFVVRSWPELASVDVAVEEGLVALADTLHPRMDQATVLRPGQRGSLQRGAVVVTTDAEATLAWMRGELVFDDRPLSEVLPAIGRRFDVTIMADPALSGRRLTARFTTRSLEAVLDAMAVTLDVRVSSRGRSITLTPTVR